MKKFLASLVAFSLFAVLFYTAGLLFFPGFLKKNLNYNLGSYGHLHTRIREIPKFRNTDILFLGSSHAYRGFDPRIFKAAGYKTFNLGSSAQTPTQTLLLLEKYLEDLNPEMVVYEVSPMIFSLDGVESTLDLIANDTITAQTGKMALKTCNIRAMHALMYSFYRQQLGLDAGYKQPQTSNDRYISGGYVARKQARFSPDSEFPSLVLQSEQLEYFDKILELLKKRNITVVLVRTPVASKMYLAEKKVPAFDKFIQSKKLPYYDFNVLLRLKDSEYFYDNDHLNQSGVALFNAKLIGIIADRKKP